MKCDTGCDWGEEASIFFSHIEGNKVVKVNLCKYCANEKGVDDPTGYSLIDLMQGMGEETSSGKRDNKANELTCGGCGFTQSDFKKTGRFGCARCYEVFNEGLESLLEAMHKNTEHTGKVPSFANDLSVGSAGLDFGGGADLMAQGELDEIPPILEKDVTSIEDSLAILRDRLDVAISEEDYEEAARIRDEIATLEEESSKNV